MTECGADHRLGKKRIGPVCPTCGAFRRSPLPRRLAGALLLAQTLTPRERSVFGLLGHGYDNRSIARELEISERTVKRYVTAILAKLDLRSRLEAGLSALIVSSCSETGGSDGPVDQAHVADDDVVVHEAGRPPTSFDALSALLQPRNPGDHLTAAQRDVLAHLTEREVSTLNSIKQRLDAVSDDETDGNPAIVKIA
jgi:DNA-binding CsgD family transcriptional regulator